MNTQSDFNVLNLRPDLGERIVNPGAFAGMGVRSGMTGALVVIAAQVLIVSVGALFCSLCGVPIGS
jgi:hypothetical protein